MNNLSDSEIPTKHAAAPDLKSKSGWLRVMNGLLRGVIVAWLAVLLAWSALHLFIVPRIDTYREVLQEQASRAIGLRVAIGSIRAQGGWLVPWFEINDVQLFDREGREALRLPRVLAAISPRSVLMGKFEQVAIESPELEIRKDGQGHIWVAGLDTTQTGDGSAADWVFSQPQLLVRRGVVHWRDESRPQSSQNAAAELTLQDVDVSLINQWFRHELRVDATPPQPLGQRLTVRGSFTKCLGSVQVTSRIGRARLLPICHLWILQHCASGCPWTKVCLCKRAAGPCACGRTSSVDCRWV